MNFRIAAFLFSSVVSVSAGAQELGFITSLFKDAQSITIFSEFAEIRKSHELGTGSSPCIFLGVCGGGAEVLFNLPSPNDRFQLELGIGAEYLRGFSARPLPDPVDLRSSVKAFPELGTYVSLPLSGVDWIEPYFGATFGFSELWNAVAYDADRKQIGLKGQTFDYGPVFGIAIDVKGAGNAFIEGGWQARRFPSLSYDTKDALPATWPRELDMSGWHFAIGWQFELKQAKEPPSFDGIWVLKSVDGGDLPETLAQTRDGDGTIRTEILGATLELNPDSRTYSLMIQERRSVLNGAAHVLSMGIVDPPHAESGSFTIDKKSGALALTSIPARTTQLVTLLGEAIVMTQVEPGHRLVFVKID